jgi:glycosyltransferase involved in cell wall biosynthesis
VKIGFFTELYPPSLGGQQQRFAELASMLVARGHEIVVVCVRHAREAEPVEDQGNGISVIREPLVPNYYKPFGGRIPRSPVGMLRYAAAVRRIARTHAFDAVFLNQWPLVHVLALPAAVRSRAVLDWCEIRESPLHRLAQSALPKLVAGNTAVASHVARHVQARATCPVLTLPSGIATAQYRAEDATRRSGLLYLGRVTRHKNLELLLQSYETLCRRGFAEPLTVAGDGPTFEAFKASVRKSPFASGVRLLGSVTDAVKYDLLASARALVLTSRREGFPRVVAEAMASGLPVVTARYPMNGTVAVIEEYECGLCADPTPEDVASRVEAVLADWSTWSSRASAAAPGLEWSHLTDRFVSFLQDIALAARSPREQQELGTYNANRRDWWRRVHRQASLGSVRHDQP